MCLVIPPNTDVKTYVIYDAAWLPGCLAGWLAGWLAG